MRAPEVIPVLNLTTDGPVAVMLRESLQRPFSVQLDVERINFRACVRTSDLQNAVEAFFNRNKCVTSEN